MCIDISFRHSQFGIDIFIVMMNNNVTWYKIDPHNVKNVIDKIPKKLCVWFDFGCHDCHIKSLKCKERIDALGMVEHNCVGEFGHDLIVQKKLYHYYSNAKLPDWNAMYMCHGLSCDGCCIYLNAIGIEYQSLDQHTFDLLTWERWWTSFGDYYCLLKNISLL